MADLTWVRLMSLCRVNSESELAELWKNDRLPSLPIIEQQKEHLALIHGETSEGGMPSPHLRLTEKVGPFDHINLTGMDSIDLTILGQRVALELLRRHAKYPDAKRQLSKTSDFLESMGDGLRRRKHA